VPSVEALRKKAESTRKKLGLTNDQVQILQDCANAVYGEISADLPPDNKKHGTCKRAVIIEVVVDAGRLKQEVVRNLARRGVPQGLDNLVVRSCRDYDDIRALIGPAFPHAEYEVAGREDY